jgi:hypothetical protein
MNESYVINDGGTGKEVPVPKRVNPLDSIVAAPTAPRTEEKPKTEPVAGDDTVAEYKGSFAGKEESLVEPKKEVVYGHCNNCRLELTEKKVVKQPIEWLKNEDGTMSKVANRFSVFCKSCMKFVTLIDKDAADMLQNMIKKGIK